MLLYSVIYFKIVFFLYQTITFYHIQQEAPALTSTAAVLTGRTSQNTAQASMNGSCQGTAKTPAESHAKLPTFGKVETLKHLLPFA